MKGKRYLLDTNTVSQLIRKNPFVINSVSQTTPELLAISAVTMGELLFGLARRPDARRLHSLVREFLNLVDVLPLDETVMEAYGPLRSKLEAAGTVLSPLDLLIAAHALSLNLTLVTNDGAFSMVPGLSVEDWSRGVPDR